MSINRLEKSRFACIRSARSQRLEDSGCCWPPRRGEIEMKRTALFAAILLASAPVFAQTRSEPTVPVGGQAMFPSKTIVANAVNSADHTTLASTAARRLTGRLRLHMG